MIDLIAAALSFAGLHLLVSGTGLRGVLIHYVGQRAYRALFSLVSIATLIWLCRAYTHAYASDNTSYWVSTHAQHIAGPVMIFALFLAVPGLVSPNPTAIGQEGLLLREPEPRGMQRITRHPFLWGVIVWSIFHVWANGDAASIVFFATFMVVAGAGTLSIDAKRKKVLGETWTMYRTQTSNIPFVALAGARTRYARTRYAFREIGAWRVLLAVAVFCALVSVHHRLFHAYPLPNME